MHLNVHDFSNGLVHKGFILSICILRVCAMFPSVNIDGVIRHIQLRPLELKEYESQVEHVVRRYIKRLQWLLSG